MPELIWEGKYDQDGFRVMPQHSAYPIRTLERYDGPVQDTGAHSSQDADSEWVNRLICGDRQDVLPSLLLEFEGKVDLVYIDPPFATGRDFWFDKTVHGNHAGHSDGGRAKGGKAYSDSWANGLDTYLQWFYETVSLLFELLSPTGSMWVHLDWRAAFQAKCVLDEVFPSGSFRNSIVWSYSGSARGAKAIARQFPRNHDVLLWYTKAPGYTYNSQYVQRRVPVAEAGRAGFRLDEQGRWFKSAPRGDYTDASVRRLDREGRIHRTRSGAVRIKYFLREEGEYVVDDVLLGDTWSDVADAMHIGRTEKTGYPTQKPLELLERIIATSSREGDLVLDCLLGSGTTAVAAERLGRRWIGGDCSEQAIEIARTRLTSLSSLRPFVTQRLVANELGRRKLTGRDQEARRGGAIR